MAKDQPVQPTPTGRFGGSFAPPITDDKLKEYEQLAKERKGTPVGDAMESLCLMVREFQKTGKSKLKGMPHPSGRGTITKLEPDEIKRIDPVVPWSHECEAMQRLFDDLPSRTQDDKQARNAAFHLLWYAKELTADREPLTNDQL